MNKATIYIDPNDDITNIISDLKKVKPKIVALVPPKKTDVLHSSVNIKLIQKTATEIGKVVVLVTNDPVILRLAKTSKVPVAENLQSRPSVPGSEPKELKNAEDSEKPEKEEKAPEAETQSAEASSEKTSAVTEEFIADNNSVEEIIDSIEADKETEEKDEKSEKADADSDEKSEKKEKKKKEKDPFKSNKKKWIIFGSLAGVGIILFFIWALVLAPAVTIAVSVKTTSSNFSENVSFTEKESEENIDESRFYIRQEKISKEGTVKFTATGKKDIGEKASGAIVASIKGASKYYETIPAGTVLKHNGLEYKTESDATFSWDGVPDSCPSLKGKTLDEIIASGGCENSAEIKITASSPGDNYNVSERADDWAGVGISNITFYNSGPISGGTSEIVTVVQQSDVDSALDKLKSENAVSGKEEIMKKLSETTFPIETSFKTETSDPVSIPAVGEEVKEGVTPTVSSETSYTMFTLDYVRIEDYIKKKANIPDDREIYSVGEPFLEYFIESEGGYSAKLKTTYKVGPKVSETDILEKSQGKKIGEVQSLLKSINGVNSVNIKKSVFWVNSIPNDVNKITIELNIEE